MMDQLRRGPQNFGHRRCPNVAMHASVISVTRRLGGSPAVVCAEPGVRHSCIENFSPFPP